MSAAAGKDTLHDALQTACKLRVSENAGPAKKKSTRKPR